MAVFYRIIVVLNAVVTASAMAAGDGQALILEDGISPDAQLFAGERQVCLLDRDELSCWGRSYSSGKLTVPQLQQITAVALGSEKGCALAQQQLRCWGMDAKVHVVFRPYRLALGQQLICVVDARGLLCGGIWQGLEAVPLGSDPHAITAIAAGSKHGCALVDGAVTCWGDDQYGQVSSVPAMSGVRQVSAYENQTCALDSKGVHCWGDEEAVADVPRLNSPRAVATGYQHACALVEDGVQCWGHDTFGETSPPPMLQPTRVVSGLQFSCAIDGQTLKCWGDL